MKLSAQEVFSAYTTVAGLLSASRPMPLAVSGRLVGLAASLKADFEAINSQRNELIRAYAATADGDQFEVPADKVGDFGERMAELEPVECAVEPIRISDFLMAFGGTVQLALTLQELILLGPLVEE